MKRQNYDLAKICKHKKDEGNESTLCTDKCNKVNYNLKISFFISARKKLLQLMEKIIRYIVKYYLCKK